MRLMKIIVLLNLSFTICAQNVQSNEKSINPNDTSKVVRFITEYCLEFNRNSTLRVINNIESTLDSLEQHHISVLFSEITIAGVDFIKTEIGCALTEIWDREQHHPFILYQVTNENSHKKIYIIQGKGYIDSSTKEVSKN